MSERERPTEEIPSQLRESWRDIPEGHVSVYHYANRESLESIAEGGLTHFSERTPESELDISQKHRIAFDTMCDRVAERIGIDFRRSQAVFASPDKDDEKSKWQNFGEVRLEVKLDPENTYVYDRTLYSAASFAFYRTPEGRRWLDEDPDTQQGTKNRTEIEKAMKSYPEDYEEYIRRYLERRMKLSQFLTLSDEERERQLERPEVAIIEIIQSERIRAS